MRLSQSIPFAAPVAKNAVPGEEAELVRSDRAASHMNEAAFREFYNETAPRLRGYIRRVSGDAALADDVLQEAFYRFLRADLPPGERWQLKAYLYRTANSILGDYWRRVKRERRWKLLWPFGEAEAAEAPSEQGEAMRLFRRLSSREQTLLWLAYVEEFDHREIAATLRLGEKSVRVLLFRARRKLRKALEREN